MSRREVDLRLVVEHELVRIDRAAQLLLERRLAHDLRAELGAVELVLPPALVLRVIERGVGALDQRCDLGSVIREERDADAARVPHALARDGDRIRDEIEDAPRDLLDGLERREARHQDRELVAAEARHLGQHGRRGARERVAAA